MQVSAFKALQDWLHPTEDVQARPESEYVTLTMTKTNLNKRGAFWVPKVDVEQVSGNAGDASPPPYLLLLRKCFVARCASLLRRGIWGEGNADLQAG
jgi:hypothetical protein